MLLLILTVLTVALLSASASAGRLSLLPWPTSVEMTAGVYSVADGVRLRVSPQAASAARVTIESAAAEDVKSRIILSTGRESGWWIAAGKASLPETPEGQEAYRLSVSPRGIGLAASTETGFRHGVRTLVQLLAHSDEIPACEIDDEPVLAFRAFMVVHDMFTGVSDKDRLPILEEMASYKMNVLHLMHVKHILQDPTTREVLRKLIIRAEELGVTVIPEIDMRPTPNLMQLSSDELEAEHEKKISEMADIFPGPYIHIGNDEVRFGSTDSVSSQIAMLGAERFFANYLNGISRVARKYGKTCIMWGDNIVRDALNDTLKYLDPDIIVQDWNYYQMPPTRGVRLMQDAGIRGVAAPAVAYSGSSVITPGLLNMDNIRFFAAHAKRYQALGLDATIWGAQRCVPGSLARAYAWAADQSWNPGGNDERSAMAAYLFHRFGLEPTPARADRIWRLREVGQAQGRMDRYMWANATALARHGETGQQAENDRYSKAVEGLASGFESDLRHVKANRGEYEALIAAAAVGEHNALRRLTAQEVVTRVKNAAAALEEGNRKTAASELRAAAQAVRLMDSLHKEVLARVKKVWTPYYGDLGIWWLTTPETEAYVRGLAARLYELADNPDLDGVKAILH